MSLRCPNCECEIGLSDHGAKRWASAVAWVCLGGLAAAMAVWLGLPDVGPKPLDAEWTAQVRRENQADSAQAEQIIRKRQEQDYEDWRNRMPPLERAVFEAARTAKIVGIVCLVLGLPAGVLALAIRPHAVQKRPPLKK